MKREADHAIVISSRRAVRELAIVFGVISALPAGLVLFGHQLGMRSQLPPTPLGAAAAVGVLPLLLATTVAVMAIAGVFRRVTIDERGVTMKRTMRAPMRLEWPEVRRVRWTPNSAAFEGERGTIEIYWTHGAHDGTDTLGKALLAKHLQPHFDLSDPPRPPRWSLASIGRIGFATCLFALPIYLMYQAAIRNPAQMRFWALMMMFWQIAPILWALVLVYRSVQRPDSPARWRTRIA